ncbi:hypothetical protein BDV96DRAFT_52385 [Lophiotrema nucula]|uniref:Uncharacterized protein n=1 Tax=Lophiotrema nucula TaxID=690887 RepID=A0A6A5ZAF0_9PLEO|nr:hypothetical protein BDV96DRAFT_52385 [Lophiotrema nucula]
MVMKGYHSSSSVSHLVTKHPTSAQKPLPELSNRDRDEHANNTKIPNRFTFTSHQRFSFLYPHTTKVMQQPRVAQPARAAKGFV